MMMMMMMILSLRTLLSTVLNECVCSSSAFAKCQLKSAALKSYQQPGLWAERDAPEKNNSFFEAVQNSQLWFQFRSVEVRIWLFSIARSFFGGGDKCKSEAKYHKTVQNWEVPMLEIPQLRARSTGRPFTVIQVTFNLSTGHIIAASYPLGSCQTWFRALDWWKKENVSAHAHSSRSSLYKLVVAVANFQITPSTWVDV